MAGIGFKLREMVARKTFAQWVTLYAYSALIFSGPWLISNLALGALSLFALPAMQEIEVRIFTVTIVYTYCFSLILTGLIHLLVTRYVSDQLYLRKPDSVVPSFVGAMVVTIVAQTMIGAAALFFAEIDLLYKIATLGLYVTVSLIWIEMLFLSAAKDYANIVASFALGYLVSFLGALGLGLMFKLDGLVIGFLMGQVVLMVLLMYRIFAEYRFGLGFDFAFLGYFKVFPTLALAGFLYNAAIWVDKIVFWYSPDGLHIHTYFYTHFPYDSAMFVAYMSIIPTLAIFLLRIETEFYFKYKNYYGAILQKAPMEQILRRKADMMEVLRDALKSVFIYQGCGSAGVFILMPYLVSLMGIDPEMTPVFRVAVVGVFFHACLLVLMILFLYFDFRGSAAFLSAMFLVTNCGLSILSLYLGPAWHGFGYGFSCLATLLAGIALFSNRIRNLEYLTFMRQPVG